MNNIHQLSKEVAVARANYKDWVGFPVRLFATVSIFLGVMGPFIMLRFQRLRRCGCWQVLITSLAFAIMPGMNSYLFKQPVLGERFEALGIPASVVGLAVVLMAIIPSAIVSFRGRRERSAG